MGHRSDARDTTHAWLGGGPVQDHKAAPRDPAGTDPAGVRHFLVNQVVEHGREIRNVSGNPVVSPLKPVTPAPQALWLAGLPLLAMAGCVERDAEDTVVHDAEDLIPVLLVNPVQRRFQLAADHEQSRRRPGRRVAQDAEADFARCLENANLLRFSRRSR